MRNIENYLIEKSKMMMMAHHARVARNAVWAWVFPIFPFGCRALACLCLHHHPTPLNKNHYFSQRGMRSTGTYLIEKSKMMMMAHHAQVARNAVWAGAFPIFPSGCRALAYLCLRHHLTSFN